MNYDEKLSENYSESSNSMPKPQSNTRQRKSAPILDETDYSDNEIDQTQRKKPENLSNRQNNLTKRRSEISEGSDEYENANRGQNTRKSSIMDDLETGDDDIDNLLESSAVAAKVSREIPNYFQASDDYDVETEIYDHTSTEHLIPPQISSDNDDYYYDQTCQTEGNVDQTLDDHQIDYKQAHKVFDRLNKLYKHGDEPIWDSISKESSFDFSYYVSEKINDLKKKNTGKILLDDVRNSK